MVIVCPEKREPGHESHGMQPEAAQGLSSATLPTETSQIVLMPAGAAACFPANYLGQKQPIVCCGMPHAGQMMQAWRQDPGGQFILADS